MKIFIDTAKLNEIKEAISWGIVDGITTNPSLIREAIEKTNENLEDYIKKILKIAGEKRPVSLEIIGLKTEEMVKEARILYRKFNKVAKNVVIKIPINTYKGDLEGIKAIRILSKEGIPINCTLIMKPEQALLAAKAGARYVSPFAGRIDDYIREKKLGMKRKIDFQKYDYFPKNGYFKKDIFGKSKLVDDNGIVSGVDLVKSIVNIFSHYNFNTEIIASSIRNSRQVKEIATTGVEIATIPFKVLQEMLRHPKTEEGIKNFTNDAQKTKYKDIFKD